MVDQIGGKRDGERRDEAGAEGGLLLWAAQQGVGCGRNEWNAQLLRQQREAGGWMRRKQRWVCEHEHDDDEGG
jgi:hypothetical protein